MFSSRGSLPIAPRPEQQFMLPRAPWSRGERGDGYGSGYGYGPASPSELEPLSRGDSRARRRSSCRQLDDQEDVQSDGGLSGLTAFDTTEVENADGRSWTERLCAARDLHEEKSSLLYAVKWLVPALTFLLCFILQNVMLHVATYFYVQWMYRLHRGLKKTAEEVTSTGDQLSSSLSEGSLHDLTALMLGIHSVPMQIMDCLSLLVPLIWLVMVVFRLNLHLFTKCCACGSFLALGKGFISVITVLPDSIGWEACKERLGPEGIEFFKSSKNLDFGDHFWRSVLHIVEATVIPGFVEPEGRVLRFCADMLYSGHTYFATLFSIGLYDASKHFLSSTKVRDARWRFVYRLVLGVALTMVVLVDAAFILMNKFHYSIDVFLAILIVFLYYTNAAIARMVIWWADEVWVPKGNRMFLKREMGGIGGGYGEIYLPPCCCPFCLISGRYSIQNTGEESVLAQAVLGHFLYRAVTDPQKFVDELEEVVKFHQTNPDLDLPPDLKFKQDFPWRLKGHANKMLRTKAKSITSKFQRKFQVVPRPPRLPDEASPRRREQRSKELKEAFNFVFDEAEVMESGPSGILEKCAELLHRLLGVNAEVTSDEEEAEDGPQRSRRSGRSRSRLTETSRGSEARSDAGGGCCA